MNASRRKLPDRAMVLAAGIGQRMMPLTADRPKPMVEVMGRALIDHMLDRLAAAGVTTAVVNLHHFADLLETHLESRKAPRIVVSDERGGLLQTGGGIVHALPLLGGEPFVLVNSDSLWIDGTTPELGRLAERFDPLRMDALLLLAPTEGTIGYDGRGDYALAADGELRRRAAAGSAPYVYAGGAILAPGLFAGAPAGAFPLNRLLHRAEAAGRLFGVPMHGVFLHVGTPGAIALAEEAIRRAAA